MKDNAVVRMNVSMSLKPPGREITILRLLALSIFFLSYFLPSPLTGNREPQTYRSSGDAVFVMRKMSQFAALASFRRSNIRYVQMNTFSTLSDSATHL